MGRRKKAAKKVVKKKRPTVPTKFKCLFCNHEGSVSCKLDFNTMTGSLSCRICDEKYETYINTLTEPVDLFSEWLDETSERQKEDARGLRRPVAAYRRDVDEDRDDDDAAYGGGGGGGGVRGGASGGVSKSSNAYGDDDDEEEEEEDFGTGKVASAGPSRKNDDDEDDNEDDGDEEEERGGITVTKDLQPDDEDD